jgi:uncharacterized protein (TIGR02453 family)
MNVVPLLHFLTELRFNNNKTWFDANRSRYETLRLEFTDFMAEVIEGVAEFDESVGNITPKSTLFRINRDIRFSNNKVPYKTTFSAGISPGGRNAGLPVYYLQIGANESLVGGGMYFSEASVLQNIRSYIERFPKKADALLNDKTLKRKFGGLSTEGNLQRFPKGYPETSELLKYKSFTVGKDLTNVDKLSVKTIVKHYQDMLPLQTWLRDAVTFRPS